MLRYVLIILLMLGLPLGAICLHYAPLKADNTVSLPMTTYHLKGPVITYETPLNIITPSDLVLPVKDGLKKAHIHLKSGPGDSAYPYIITPKGDKPIGGIQAGDFFLSGTLMQNQDGHYQIRYNNEILALPQKLVAHITSLDEPQLRAIWHIRANGNSRLAGLDIDGEFMPYQFNLKAVLLGLTQ